MCRWKISNVANKEVDCRYWSNFVVFVGISMGFTAAHDI